ncbi:MAG TPA: hypothetical protein VGO68_00935 [Pyrinomonadaceae bacterium]|jgi:hypothetical protein|nr:hypothetical protein [Pyrinomonadaceae bacterium]
MKYVLLLVVGLVIGAAAAIFFLGVPSAKAIPGAAVQAPPPGGDPPGTVVVSVSDSFLNEMLGTVFRDLGPPSFKLAHNVAEPGSANFEKTAFQAGACANTMTLAAEGSGAKTQVKFDGGKITAPLAFSGNYNLLGNCTQFKGWAQTTIQLSFDQPNQTLYGRLNVEAVNLEGVNPLASNFVTVFVRSAIDDKVNPIQFLRPQQLQLLIPMQASNGSVKAQVKDVRSDVQDGSLRLHITYGFAGTKGQTPQG